MKYVNLNGKLLKAEDIVIKPDNPAFRYGYGLFETMLVQDGIIQLKEYHWERLFEGLKQLNFDLPVAFSPAVVEAQVLETVEKNNMAAVCRVRLQVYADSAARLNVSQEAGFIIECLPLEPHFTQFNEAGLQAGIAVDLAKSADSTANLKTCNALMYLLAAQQAMTNKWDDALVRNTKGNIIESTIANILLIKNKIIYTPPLADGCIAGVMRRYIIDTLKTLGIVVREKSITEEDLYDANELFLTNAIRRIKWVSKLQDKEFGKSYTKHISGLLFPVA